MTLIASHLEDVHQNRLPVIQRKTGYSMETIKAALEELQHLNPWPGRGFDEQKVQKVTPDVCVEQDETGKYVVRLEDEYTPSLRISRFCLQQLRNNPDAQTKEYLKKKIDSAKWFIDAVNQRQLTLYKIATEIFKRQRDFLDHGIAHLHPLKMQDIADRVGIMKEGHLVMVRGRDDLKYENLEEIYLNYMRAA